MKVELLTETYSDLTVVNAARVSFAKHKTEIDEGDKGLLRYLWEHKHWSPFAHPQITFVMELTDDRMLAFLLNANQAGFEVVKTDFLPHAQRALGKTYHIKGSLYAWLSNIQHLPGLVATDVLAHLQRDFPHSLAAAGFTDTYLNLYLADMYPDRFLTNTQLQRPELRRLQPITVRVAAPIFVARQLAKHQQGLAWNEVSRRYVDTDPTYYLPTEWRKKAADKKQGSSDETITIGDSSAIIVRDRDGYGYRYRTVNGPATTVGMLQNTYEGLRALEVCPEQARIILPQAMYTEWYWSGSLAAFDRVLEQRLKPDTQKETQHVAGLLKDALEAEGYPV